MLLCKKKRADEYNLFWTQSNKPKIKEQWAILICHVLFTDKCILFTLRKYVFRGQWNQCVDNGLFVLAITDNKRRKWKVVGAAKAANYQISPSKISLPFITDSFRYAMLFTVVSLAGAK